MENNNKKETIGIIGNKLITISGRLYKMENEINIIQQKFESKKYVIDFIFEYINNLVERIGRIEKRLEKIEK